MAGKRGRPPGMPNIAKDAKARVMEMIVEGKNNEEIRNRLRLDGYPCNISRQGFSFYRRMEEVLNQIAFKQEEALQSGYGQRARRLEILSETIEGLRNVMRAISEGRITGLRDEITDVILPAKQVTAYNLASRSLVMLVHEVTAMMDAGPRNIPAGASPAIAEAMKSILGGDRTEESSSVADGGDGLDLGASKTLDLARKNDMLAYLLDMADKVASDIAAQEQAARPVLQIEAK